MWSITAVSTISWTRLNQKAYREAGSGQRGTKKHIRMDKWTREVHSEMLEREARWVCEWKGRAEGRGIREREMKPEQKTKSRRTRRGSSGRQRQGEKQRRQGRQE